MPVSKEKRTADTTLLRRRAEERVGEESKDVVHQSPDQIKALLHDLHVHQIELEMQNEQLRASQMELESARERMAELYDFAPVGYLTLDQSGKILQANLTSVTMLGVERTGLVSQQFSHFVFNLDQDRCYSCLRKVFNDHLRQVCELRLRPDSGPVFFGRLEAIWAVEADQSVCRMILSDITEHKRAEERYLEMERRQVQYESEEWKRLALEAGELGAWDQDLHKSVITCSGAACKMIGFEENALPKWEQVVQRIHDEDRPKFLLEIERSTRPDGTRRVDTVFRAVLPDGGLRWLRLVARTSFDLRNGRIRAARRTGVVADITPLKQAEETLRTHSEKLEGLVRERTARLQEVVAELEHLSYTLVHDLRAPLRAITGYTVLLLEQCRELEPTHRMFLERSSAAAVRMDNLILDTLAYSQIARERSPLERVDALALLRQLIETYPQFQEAAGCITVEAPWPPVIGNLALLTQCFSNLLTNALKFVAPGQAPRVRIYAKPDDKRICICFEDNGIGIDEAGKQRLFRMFQRLQTSYEGTGIGLALVKKAAERMNGSVGVESELGRGSRFWLDLEKACEAGGGTGGGTTH